MVSIESEDGLGDLRFGKTKKGMSQVFTEKKLGVSKIRVRQLKGRH